MYNVSFLQNRDNLLNITKRVITEKEYQLRADPKIQKGVAATLASYIDAFYFTGNSLIINEKFYKKGNLPLDLPLNGTKVQC